LQYYSLRLYIYEKFFFDDVRQKYEIAQSSERMKKELILLVENK